MAKKSSIVKRPAELRVVGGKHRSRKLRVIDREGLRPTGDRMREVVFNWLMPWVDGARVVDLFAGSGALGVEAVSRGARHAVFIEKNRDAYGCLEANVSLLERSEYQLIQQGAFEALGAMDISNIDIVFLDPPFSEKLWDGVLSELTQKLPKHAIIYVEAPSDQDLGGLHGYEWVKHKRQGQVQFGLLQKPV